MKKILLVPFLICLFVACTNTLDTDDYPKFSNNQTCNSYDYIIQKAQKAYDGHYGEFKSRTSKKVAKIDFIVSNKSRAGIQDTLIYVVNYADNGGYVLIGNKSVNNEIIGVVSSGNYNPSEGTDNPCFAYYLEAAENYVVNSTNGDQVTIDTSKFQQGTEWKLVYDTVYCYHLSPMLKEFEWGQDLFYGKYCPNKLCGCAPLAMGNIITYYGAIKVYDSNLVYTFPERTLSNQTIGWKKMYNHKREEVTYGGVTHPENCIGSNKEAMHENIAHLLRQLGYESHSEYVDSITLTERAICRTLLQKYLPTQNITEYQTFDNMSMSQILDKGLVFMGAPDKNSNIGHAWIADGYHKCKYYEKLMQTVPGTTLTGERIWKVVSTKEVLESTIHMNWGWHGKDNGYFSGKVFDCSGHAYYNSEYLAISNK